MSLPEKKPLIASIVPKKKTINTISNLMKQKAGRKLKTKISWKNNLQNKHKTQTKHIVTPKNIPFHFHNAPRIGPLAVMIN